MSVHLLISVIVCLNSRVYTKMTARRIKVHEIPYRIERQIGHGLHSLVYGGHDLRTNQPVAIKVINFMHGSSSVKADTIARRQSYAKEIKMLLYLQPVNPYVIRVFNHDHNDRYGVIVMERGQTFRDFLTSYVRRKKPIPPALARHFWFQMVQAIAFLHRIHIVHGDCKPENFIQVGADRKNLRLIDMGISFHLPDTLTSRLRTITGTPDYISPEMINTRIGRTDQSRYGYKADVWALGVILYEMTFGVRPLQTLPNNDIKLGYLSRLRRDISIPKHPDKQLRHVLKSCLRSNPRRRLSVEKVLKHPYLTRDRKARKDISLFE